MAGLLRKPGETLPSFGDHPHQPSNFKFPLREFDRKTIGKGAFQSTWFIVSRRQTLSSQGAYRLEIISTRL